MEKGRNMAVQNERIRAEHRNGQEKSIGGNRQDHKREIAEKLVPPEAVKAQSDSCMICTEDQPEQPEMPQQDGGGVEQPCRKQKSSKKEQEILRMEWDQVQKPDLDGQKECKSHRKEYFRMDADLPDKKKLEERHQECG